MDIEIGAITVDVENFRHAKVSNDRDAMRLLLADEKTHKLSELARDIINQRGLDPSSRLIVTEHPDAPATYIALEGNRRITALKAMMTPEIAEGLPLHHLYRQLSPYFITLNIKVVDCVVLDRPTAAKWIKRKHYKGMGGEAVQQWNAVATARSDASEGVYTRWMTALAFLELHGVDAEDLRQRIASKTTTVERALTSTHTQASLGLIFDRAGSLKADNDDEAGAVKLLLAMFQAMADPAFRETRISTKDQQEDWLAQFLPLSVKKPPPPPAAPPVPPAGTAPPGPPSLPTSPRTPSVPAGTKSPPTRSKPVRERAFLADKGLRISNSNLNAFYAELRKLKVESYPFSSAALIRIFLEKSSVAYLEALKVPPLNTSAGATWLDVGIKLRSKVNAVLHKLDPNRLDKRLSPAWEIADGHIDKLHSLDMLNKAIHDHTVLPAPSEIITVWNRYHPYFERLFEGIENAGK